MKNVSQETPFIRLAQPSPTRTLLGMRFNPTSAINATAQVIQWAKQRASRYVLLANVHMTMTAFYDASFAEVVAGSDFALPDGKPTVWALRALGFKTAEHIRGTDFTLSVCQAAATARIKVGLYGGTKETLQKFEEHLKTDNPNLKIVCRISPPFRDLTEQEDGDYVKQIVDSGAQILLVGLGCPKQEYWMASHQGRIPAVMLGVGAAFDFLSGRRPMAPVWVQNIGFEWFFRLLCEPRRLWKRYLIYNTSFVILFALQWVMQVLLRIPVQLFNQKL